LRGDSGSTGVDGGVMRVCSGSDDFAGPRADAGIDLGAPTLYRSKSHLRIIMGTRVFSFNRAANMICMQPEEPNKIMLSHGESSSRGQFSLRKHAHRVS
jgi:hypothetical protein